MTSKEEKYSRRRYQSSYITTIVSITLVLFMMGILGLIILHANRLSDYVSGPKLALITHDMDYIVNRERLKLEYTAERRIKSEKETARLERIETEAYRRFDTILTVTTSDAEVLGGISAYEGKNILPLPLYNAFNIHFDLNLFSVIVYPFNQDFSL